MQDPSRENELKTIYSLLHSSFGAQGWWPVHSEGGRGYHHGDFSTPSTDTQRFEIAIGAILTQQASWKNASRALRNLMENEMLNPSKIGDASVEDIQPLIRSSGYFRQKAERIRIFSRFLMDRYDGSMASMLSGDFSAIRGELLSLKGIGNETADSIMLYAGNIPTFVVDAYTFRMAERTGIYKGQDYNHLKRLFESSIEPDFRIYNEFHALIVELGKRHCKKKPSCAGCPISSICAYHKKL